MRLKGCVLCICGMSRGRHTQRHINAFNQHSLRGSFCGSAYCCIAYVATFHLYNYSSCRHHVAHVDKSWITYRSCLPLNRASRNLAVGSGTPSISPATSVTPISSYIAGRRADLPDPRIERRRVSMGGFPFNLAWDMGDDPYRSQTYLSTW